MSNRVKQRLPERRFQTLGAMPEHPDPTPPFSYRTTKYNYAATDCDFAHRRHAGGRSTTVLGGVPYYGYRYYNPDLGRWVNRDPLGDRALRKMPFFFKQPVLRAYARFLAGGRNNIYCFVYNEPLDSVDLLGLACTVYFKCTLYSETDQGKCDKQCEYSCTEYNRIPRGKKGFVL